MLIWNLSFQSENSLEEYSCSIVFIYQNTVFQKISNIYILYKVTQTHNSGFFIFFLSVVTEVCELKHNQWLFVPTGLSRNQNIKFSPTVSRQEEGALLPDCYQQEQEPILTVAHISSCSEEEEGHKTTLTSATNSGSVRSAEREHNLFSPAVQKQRLL